MLFMSCVFHAFASVHGCLVCWERADLLALVCDVKICFCYIPMWYPGSGVILDLLIPDLCCFSYFVMQPPFLSNKTDCKNWSLMTVSVLWFFSTVLWYCRGNYFQYDFYRQTSLSPPGAAQHSRVQTIKLLCFIATYKKQTKLMV